MADSNVKIRVGIDANSFIHVDYYDVSESRWVQFGRSGYPVAEGRQFKLGVKFGGYQGRLHTAPKVHLLEPEAPTMYFRYVESPDGVFQYPLFATIEEAQYYHKTLTGDPVGQYHEHTYADDPTGTTWYMPDNGQMAGTLAPYNLVFQGVTSLFTEITTLSNADLAPPLFSQADIVAEEGTAVNIQINPVDVTYSTSVSVSPAGSGLVWDGYHMLQGTLADVGADTVYTVTVTRGNSYGSRTGQMTITATDVTPPQTNLTPWTKALDFSGSSERALQVSTSSGVNPMMMTGLSSTTSFAASGQTSSDGYSRPWATACVFKYDGNNSNQHIWNAGEGSSGDNIYLRISATGYLYFGWGRSGTTSAINECGLGGSLSTDKWWGVYIGHNGTRLSTAQATPTNLAECFDIYLMRLNDAGTEWVTKLGTLTDAGGNRSIASNWYQSGARMDRATTGQLSIGGRGANRSFHGKVASMVVTTLRRGYAMPTKTEAEMMITDPKQWEDVYRVGQVIRNGNSGSTSTYNPASLTAGYGCTQIWLMGDGTNDSYSNMIRNQVYPQDQNYTKLNMISMVSNDIQNVTIPGLT